MPKTNHSEAAASPPRRRGVSLSLARPICVEPFNVVADDWNPNDENRWPHSALYREGVEAFCEVQRAIRKAQICRAILTRRVVLPTGFSTWGDTWEDTRPTLDTARLVVARARPALLIGYFGPLKQKGGCNSLERESHHDRAIAEAAPLIDALGAIQLEDWSKMTGAERWKLAWGLPKIDDHHMTHTLLEFMYIEAKGASALLKLSDDDQRIVIGGSYACRRLDALDENSADDEALQERIEHETTIKNLCNDLGQHDLAEKIEAAIGNPAMEATFPRSVLYDRFKGHLIDAIKERWPTTALNPAVAQAPVGDAQVLAAKDPDASASTDPPKADALAVTVAVKSNSRGRLSKADSEAKRASMLATICQHPSLKDDPATLGNMVGVSESTIRRWLDDEEINYRKSMAANPAPLEE